MRKKTVVSVLAVLATAAVLGSGCARICADLNIAADGATTMTASMAFEKTVLHDYMKASYADMNMSITDEEIETDLIKSGYSSVTIDGVEYYEMPSESQNYASLYDVYTGAVSESSAISFSMEENDSLSLSETSAEFYIPAGNRAAEDLLGNTSDDELGTMNSINETLGISEDALKDATVVYKVTFATEIADASEGVVVSEDKKTATFTFPMISEKDITMTAYCVNDIKATGARSGLLYGKDITVTVPEDATATVNGEAVNDNEITFTNSGRFNVLMKATDGTQESIVFAMDKDAPAVEGIKEKGIYKKSKKFTCYDKVSNMAEMKLDDTVVYDGEFDLDAQVAHVTLKDIVTDDSAIQGYYNLFEFSMANMSNGKHTVELKDTLGNTKTLTFTVDGKKPTVKGVKNGKTYKKAVKVKFSDNNAVKKATLNGKKIKSGKKVSKKGNYTLQVTDKAGNKTTVKFKIK